MKSPTAVLLALIAGLASAEPAPPDRALAIAASDATLAWNPCPAFMPEGCAIAVLHGDPAQPNADVFFRVPGGATVPRHWHTSAERIVLVSGELEVTYDGQAPATLTPGMYAYGPPRASHSASCAAGAPCVLFIAFEGAVDAHASDTIASP